MTLENDFVDANPTATVHAAHHNALATSFNSLSTPPVDGGVIYTDSPSWTSGRFPRDGALDGLVYVRNFTDASGRNAGEGAGLTYTKLYGGWGSKTGHGNLDAFWTSMAHYGPGEVGLFIGDVTAKTTGAGGNIWGGHLQLNAEVAANMLGLLVELNPEVDVASRSTFGVYAHNTSTAQHPIDALMRTAGAATRHIICYSDNAATAIIFDVDQSGNVRNAGTLTPLVSGSQDIGSVSYHWRSIYVNNILVNNADSANVAGGLSLASISAPTLRANTNGGTLYVVNGKLFYQGTGGSGTTPVCLATAGGIPTLTIQTAAGSGASASHATASNDSGGTVGVVIGGGATSGNQVRIVFSTALSVTPRSITITPSDAASHAAGLYVTSQGTAGFMVTAANTPTTFMFCFHVDP